MLSKLISYTLPSCTCSSFILYWVGQKVRMVFSIKYKTDFSFSRITLLIWIFRVCQLSPMWYNIDCSQLMSRFHCYQLQHGPVRNLQQLPKSLLTCLISHSSFSLHCTNLFSHFSCVFTFLEIIKHNILKNVVYFLPSSVLKWLHKIVSNEVKDS